jgi:hypothetical protein
MPQQSSCRSCWRERTDHFNWLGKVGACMCLVAGNRGCFAAVRGGPCRQRAQSMSGLLAATAYHQQGFQCSATDAETHVGAAGQTRGSLAADVRLGDRGEAEVHCSWFPWGWAGSAPVLRSMQTLIHAGTR